MKTEREKEIEKIYGKSIWDMTAKEMIDNNLVHDYVCIVDTTAEWINQTEND